MRGEDEYGLKDIFEDVIMAGFDRREFGLVKDVWACRRLRQDVV